MRLQDVKFDKFEMTTQGFLVADAFLTRSGVFDYSDGKGGVIRELRPAEEVFSKESLDSLKFAPLTKHHPDEMVTLDNVKKFQVGMIGENITRHGDKVKGKIIVTDKTEIKEILDKHGKGEAVELSMGYDAELSDISGKHPSEGHFDKTQQKIRYNHGSIVDKGRAGREVKLIMDAEREASTILDAEVIDGEALKKKMHDQERPLQTIIISKETAGSLSEAQAIAREFLKEGESLKKSEETSTSFRFRQIDPGKFAEGSFKTFQIPKKEGVSLVFGTLKKPKKDNKEVRMKFKKDSIDVGGFRMDAIVGDIAEDSKGVVDSLSGKLDEAVTVIEGHVSKADEVTKAHDELQGKFDQLEKDHKEAKADLADFSNPGSEKVRAMLKARADLEGVAKILEVKVDKEDGVAKTDKELKVDIILKTAPEFKADEKSDDYISARFDAVAEAVKSDSEKAGTDSMSAFLKDAKKREDKKEDPREKFMKDSAALGKTEK